ncbi:MAG: hypothetical protein ABI542_11620 [Gemmatimonadota bacterium]
MSRQDNTRRVRAAEERLRALFARAGYIRWRSRDRLTASGSAACSRGDEVRLVVRHVTEAKRVQRWCERVGLNAGKPFPKHGRVVQPVYGAEAVGWFAGG